MQAPLVSIIIPCYNYGKYLAGAIDSAIMQTYQETEIMVVDDGSTDNTKDIANRYPVQYLPQKHLGVAVALNNGIRQSQGEFFLCLGADDKLGPEYVRRTVEQIVNNPSVGFVATGSKIWNEENRIGDVWIPHKIHNKYAIFAGWSGVLGTVLVRRAAFDSLEYGFDARLPVYEDLDLCFRLLRKGWKLKIVSDPLHWYRLHKNARNTAANETKKYVESLMNSKYGLIELYKKFHLLYESIFGRVVSLMFHPLAYLRGIKEKVRVRLYIESCKRIYSGNLDYAEEIAHEISVTIDRQIEWSWNTGLSYYYARRRRILESRLMRMLADERTSKY